MDIPGDQNLGVDLVSDVASAGGAPENSAGVERSTILATARRVVAKLAAAAASTIIVLGFLEVVVRFAAPQQLILLRPDIWQGCPELGWCMAANLDTRVNTGEREVRLVTDEHGHRVSGRGAAAPPDVRILALGDSFLAGIQVGYDDLVTAVLERRLSSRADRLVEVVNASVGGWGPSHYLIELRHELDRASLRRRCRVSFRRQRHRRNALR